MSSPPNQYWSDFLTNPKALEPPDYGSTPGNERQYSYQWFRSLLFHYLKSWILWGLFGILPFWWVPWNGSTAFWLQLVPWVVVGTLLNHRFLPKMEMHHMVSAQDLAAFKVKGAFIWALLYLELILTFGSLAIF
jgi:hypothetical protein